MQLMRLIGIALLVLASSFICSLFIYQAAAFIAPTQAPPQGNAAFPINVSDVLQIKAGALGATAFYDTNDPSYFMNPSGTSVLGGTLSLSGHAIQNVIDPANRQDAATKNYVEQAAQRCRTP